MVRTTGTREMISLLGELGGPRAAVMNFAGFLLYGVLVLGLAAGLHKGILNGPGDWLGPLLMAVYGLGYVAVAFAPCNPGCTGTSSTASEQAHFLISRVIFLAAVAAPFVLFARLAKDPAWSSLRYLYCCCHPSGTCSPPAAAGSGRWLAAAALHRLHPRLDPHTRMAAVSSGSAHACLRLGCRCPGRHTRNAILVLVGVALVTGACSRHPTYGQPAPRTRPRPPRQRVHLNRRWILLRPGSFEVA